MKTIKETIEYCEQEVARLENQIQNAGLMSDEIEVVKTVIHTLENLLIWIRNEM